MVYYDPLFGIDLWPPDYLLDALGLPLPIDLSLIPAWSTLAPTRVTWLTANIPVANNAYYASSTICTFADYRLDCKFKFNLKIKIIISKENITMITNCLKAFKKVIFIFGIIIVLGLMTFIPEGSSQILAYYQPAFYPPTFFNYSYGYLPIPRPGLMAPPLYLYPPRNASTLLNATPGGGTTTLLTSLLTPTAPATTPTLLGLTTAITLAAGGGGGTNATTLALLAATPAITAPTTTPTIGTTTLLLLGGGVNTTTLLLLGI